MKYIIIVISLFLLLFTFESANASIVAIRTSTSNDINELTKDLTAKQIFALAMFAEVRGESEEGKIAMATITLINVNDMKEKKIKNALRKLCLRKKFFSAFNSDDPNFSIVKKIALNWNYSYKRSYSLKHCYLIVSSLLDGTLPMNQLLLTNHVTNFQCVGCNSWWSKKMSHLVTIGNHEFYMKRRVIMV
jgi:hypothetical protein